MRWRIIFAGLRARPVRTAVTIMAVALQVALILILVGLTTGTTKEIGSRVAGVGADIMLQPGGADVILALDSATLDMAFGPKLKQLEGVQSVAPVLVRVNTQSLTNFFGIDPPSFDEVSGGLVYKKGHVFSAPDEIVIDDLFAKDKKLDVGDPYIVEKQTFKVSGIVENGKGARVFMALQKAQELANVTDKVTVYFIKLKDSSNIDGVIERMKTRDGLAGYELRNVPDYASLMNGDHVRVLDPANDVIVFIALCIGVLVIFLSMYTTIMERTREIGILRSLGASKGFIVILIMKEAFLICLVGIVVGMGSSLVIRRIVHEFLPTLQIMISPKWILYASLSALLSGVVGSFHPAFKAASQDPVDAFAYE